MAVPGATDWRAALLAAALTVPVNAFAALGADELCNHLEGDVRVADPGTPRASWCSAVQWDHHWLLLVLGPPIVTLVCAMLAGRRRWLYVPAWAVGVALAIIPVVIIGGLRAYPTA